MCMYVYIYICRSINGLLLYHELKTPFSTSNWYHPGWSRQTVSGEKLENPWNLLADLWHRGIRGCLFGLCVGTATWVIVYTGNKIYIYISKIGNWTLLLDLGRFFLNVISGRCKLKAFTYSHLLATCSDFICHILEFVCKLQPRHCQLQPTPLPRHDCHCRWIRYYGWQLG